MKPVTIRRTLGDRASVATLLYHERCLEFLRSIASESIHCVVTSPPYWGLRDYKGPPLIWGGDPNCVHEWKDSTVVRKGSTNGREDLGSTLVSKGAAKTLAPGEENDHGGTRQYRKDPSEVCSSCDAWRGQLGLEPTPERYVQNVVEVCREVHRVLRSDGTFWLNLGDSFSREGMEETEAKEILGTPWRVAFALQAEGWRLRSDIVWQKLNPMPESVRDRPTKSHEFIFLLTKSSKYFYDCDAIREPWADSRQGAAQGYNQETPERISIGGKQRPQKAPKTDGRNKRSVWAISAKPYPGAHFATFPPELPRLCVLAGTSAKGCCPMCLVPWERESKGSLTFSAACGCPPHEPVPCTVLDPFSGSGTTGQVALNLGRDYIGLDVQAGYLKLATARIQNEDAPGEEEESSGGILELLGVQDP